VGSKRSSKTFVAMLIAAGALIAGGCGSDSGSGSTLRMGIAGTTVDSLNPFVGQSSLSLMTYRVVYPYLLQYDADNKLSTDWATSYEVSKDGKTWSFKTPQGEKWSDGEPLTAEDAAWTINTIVHYKDGPAATFSSYVINVKSARATSPTSLEVELTKPTATVGDGLANIPILPQHVWEQYATGTGAELKTFKNDSPVGAGSFLVSSYTRNEAILYKRNPDYYGTEPKLAQFGFSFYSNVDALVNAIKNNEIDVALDVPPTTVKALKGDSSIDVVSEPGYDTILLGINSNPKRTTNPELQDPQVREAIALGLDRQQISDTVTLGTGGIGSSILPPNQPYVDPSIQPPVYDLDKANQMLDDLGFERGSDGIRVANGHPMSYTLYFCSCVTGAPLDVNLIVDGLEKLGIKADARESDSAAYTAAIVKDDYTQFDLSVDDYGPSFEPSDYLGIVSCGQLGAENESGYCNADYERLYAKQASQVGEARQKTLDALQQKVLEDKPLIPIYSAPNVVALRDTVTGFKPTPITIINYESKQWLDVVDAQ
jgi:peptide/nickel transport system substrate-binding protein